MEEVGDSCLYSDLLRFYGVDLSELFVDTASLSPRRVLWMVEGLPMESRTSAVLRKSPDSTGWTTSDYLTANVIDAVRENTFVNMQVRTKKRLKPFARTPIPGGEKEAPKKQNSFVAMAQKQFAFSTRKKEG